MAAVRWKQVVLFRADADVESGRADVLELSAVGCGEVEHQPAVLLRDESSVELRRDLLADLITTSADAGSNSGLDAAGSVLVLHVSYGRCGDAGTRAAPACMHEAGHFELRVPQHDRVAVRVGG